MTVYVATKNDGKMRELRAAFGAAQWQLERYAAYPDVTEGDSSYVENAALKARALHAQLRAAGIVAGALGDDSGLEVAALGGRPGVLSARYGGAEASWSQRRALLLAETAAAEPSNRRARFVCALHYIDRHGSEFTVTRDVAGTIVAAERGSEGFSYDSVFAPTGDARTFAQMVLSEKNEISHRARAATALLEAVSKNERIVV